MGDHLLQKIAQILTRVVGSFGFVARLAGDEFVVVVSNVRQQEDVTPLADAI